MVRVVLVVSADGEWRTIPKMSPGAECRDAPRRLVESLHGWIEKLD